MTRNKTLIRAGALAVLLACGLTFGCSSVHEMPVSDGMKSGDKVSAVVLLSGEVVEFDDHGGIINSYRGTIDGTTWQGKTASIKLDDVKSVRMGGTADNPDGWSLLTTGVVMGIGAFVLYYAYHVIENY
jgi:hypothetical protein